LQQAKKVRLHYETNNYEQLMTGLVRNEGSKMGKVVAISVLVVLFGVTGADATIVKLPLGCDGWYVRNSPYWETDFDLGVTFTEISHVYI